MSVGSSAGGAESSQDTSPANDADDIAACKVELPTDKSATIMSSPAVLWPERRSADLGITKRGCGRKDRVANHSRASGRNSMTPVRHAPDPTRSEH